MQRQRNEHARRAGLKAVVGLARVIGIGLLIASVVRELRLPSAERTWHGLLFGRVPYDLRPPSPGRTRAAMWNPTNPRILVPTAFGVGWTLNFGAVRARLGANG